MERCVFLAANDDTVSPIEMIRMLTKSLKNQQPLHTWGTYDLMSFFGYLLIALRPTLLLISELVFAISQVKKLVMLFVATV